MKFLMIISFLYIFCFCGVSLADVSDILVERGSVEEEVLLNDLESRINLLLNDPKSVESLKNEVPIKPIDMDDINVFLKTRLKLLNELFPLTAENLLSDLLNNHPNNKLRQMAAYLMGMWYQKEAPDKDHLTAVTSLVNAMEDPYWIIRIEAARALGQMKQGESQLFYWLENESKYEVRSSILESLYENTRSNINRSNSAEYNADYFVRRLINLAENDRDERIRIKAIMLMKYVVLNSAFYDIWSEGNQKDAFSYLVEVANDHEHKRSESIKIVAMEELSFLVENLYIREDFLSVLVHHKRRI